MSRRSLALSVAVATVLSLAYGSPALRALHATGLGDWQMVHHNWEVGWVALTRFGEWPLWDPYHCGGVTMLGNPESQHFTPWFLASLLVGNSPKWVPRVDSVNDGAIATAPCGNYAANAWGLQDLHGNASEWTRTTYQPYPYADDGRDRGGP